MKKLNCWEVLDCGRQPGGVNVRALGVCPAAVDDEADGLNGGQKAGRICWAVAGTFCGDKVQGTFAHKEIVCISCAFFNRVKDEEDAIEFQLLKPGQRYFPPQFEQGEGPRQPDAEGGRETEF